MRIHEHIRVVRRLDSVQPIGTHVVPDLIPIAGAQEVNLVELDADMRGTASAAEEIIPDSWFLS